MSEDVPYTYRILCRQLQALCGEDGYTISLNKDKYILKVRVALKSRKMKNEVDKLVERIAPLNLLLDVEILYNTHRMLHDYGLTYRELGLYTFGAIKTHQFE